MLRLCRLCRLKARPKTVNIEPGSNRFLEPAILAKAQDIFAVPVFPNKTVLHNWRFFIKAGKAATGPPVGQEFSKIGLKAMDFAKTFNDRTKPLFKDDIDLIVRIQVYFDKSYTYRIEPPPTAWFILRAIRKKRGDTGSVHVCGHYCALMTLEMCYEIAKMKQINWGKLEYPLIEVRVRRIVGQARRMGIAIIGVDTHSSPVKGMTEKQYLAESEKYRKIHMEQYNALKQKELEDAPLIERLHRPNLSPLTDKQVEEGLSDANLFNALWKSSQPNSAYVKDLRDREMARRYLNTRGWFKNMTKEEMQTVFLNYRLPEVEKQRQLNTSEEQDGTQAFWTRDGVQSHLNPLLGTSETHLLFVLHALKRVDLDLSALIVSFDRSQRTMRGKPRGAVLPERDVSLLFRVLRFISVHECVVKNDDSSASNGNNDGAAFLANSTTDSETMTAVASRASQRTASFGNGNVPPPLSTPLERYRMACTNLPTPVEELKLARTALLQALLELYTSKSDQQELELLFSDNDCVSSTSHESGADPCKPSFMKEKAAYGISFMQEIVPGLWCGSHHPAMNKELLKKHHITHICCCIRTKPVFPKDFVYMSIPADDSRTFDISRYFDRASNFIEEAIGADQGAVLVHCGAGISRGPTIAAAYLIHKLHISASHAIRLIQSKRPFAFPNTGFRQQLRIYASKHMVEEDSEQAMVMEQEDRVVTIKAVRESQSQRDSV